MSTKVLVTGATGYAASWIVKKLLDKGYTVHATVRNPDNQEKVAHLTGMGGDLKLFKADLLTDGVFDEAMSGCEYVIHTASPFILGKIKDAQKQLVDPALSGTENVLNSVNRTNSVKRVVLTSSVVAIFGDACEINDTEDGKFTEKNWNKTSSLTHVPYSYSKTVAEKRAWEMSKSQDRWDLVTIHPGFILGPSLTKRADGASIQFMTQMGNGQFKMGAPNFCFGFVDVRNIADAHIAAFENAEANGRYVTVADALTMLEMGESLRKTMGDQYPLPKKNLPKFLLKLFGPMQGFSRKYVDRNYGYKVAFDNQRSIAELNIDYFSPDQTLKDQMEQLIADGKVKKR